MNKGNWQFRIPCQFAQDTLPVANCRYSDAEMPAGLLPPAYVVRREGNSFTLLVCPQGGGVPVSHNALQHFPECHGAAGGVPCQVQPRGGVPCQVQLGGYPGQGGTLAGGVPWPGGYPGWGGTLTGGVPWLGGGTQLGQHREYLLHGGWYTSCVHAGGLSCSMEVSRQRFSWIVTCTSRCSRSFKL